MIRIDYDEDEYGYICNECDYSNSIFYDTSSSEESTGKSSERENTSASNTRSNKHTSHQLVMYFSMLLNIILTI